MGEGAGDSKWQTKHRCNFKNHHMKSYDEMKFLEISEGRCSQDSLYIRKIDRLPDYVVERQKHNLVECVPMDEHALLCFCRSDSSKDGTCKIDRCGGR